MPLKIGTAKTRYLDDYLDSGDVTDVIEWGKDKYPVEALCRNGRFVDAVTLVRRGYRMLHSGRFAQEFISILYSLETLSTMVSSGQNSSAAKAELLSFLIYEYEELSSDEVYVIAEQLGLGLYENYTGYAKLIEFIRRDFSMVYQELLHCDNMRDHFLSILLSSGDVTLAGDFVRDMGTGTGYVGVMDWENLLDSTSAESENDYENSRILQLFEHFDETSVEVLNTIMKYNDKLLSYELYWILNTLIAVRRMREFVHKHISLFDEVMDWDSISEYVTYPESVEPIRWDLEHGLRLYVPDQIRLGKIITVLIKVCGFHNHENSEPEEFSFDYWEEPQGCDMVVLKSVFDLAEELGIYNGAEADLKQVKECADEWKKWYTMVDPEYSMPNANNLYIDKYEKFMNYLGILNLCV